MFGIAILHVYFTMIAYTWNTVLTSIKDQNYTLAWSKQYIILTEHIHWKRGCAAVMCKRLWREIRLFCIQRVRSLWGLHQSTGLTPALPHGASSAMSSGDSPPVPAPSDHLQGTADRDTPERSHHLSTNSQSQLKTYETLMNLHLSLSLSVFLFFFLYSGSPFSDDWQELIFSRFNPSTEWQLLIKNDMNGKVIWSFLTHIHDGQKK